MLSSPISMAPRRTHSRPPAIRLRRVAIPWTVDTARQIVTTTVQLHHENEQVTAFRFSLDSHGHLVDGSVNNLYKELRVAAQ